MFDTRRTVPKRQGDLYEGEDNTIKNLANRPKDRVDAEMRRQDYAANRGSQPAQTANTNPRYPGIAEQFNQSQYGTRNPTAQYRAPAPQYPGQFQTTDQSGVQVTYGPTPQPNNPTNKKPKKKTAANNTEAPKYHRQTSTKGQKGNKKLRNSNPALAATVMAAHRLKAMTVALWSSAWAFKAWLIVQIPLAVLSILGLGFWYYIEYLKSEEGGKTWLEAAAGFTIRVGEFFLKDFGSAILKVFGWDLPSIESLFFLTLIANMFFSFLVIFMTVFAFAITFNHPLSGKMAALKWGTLLLALIGAAIPGLNLFPWILLYIWVVALYPR